MRLLFFTHDSNLNGGAQKCLYDLIKGLKTYNPSYEIHMLFPCEGDMIEWCRPYFSGYTIAQGEWWLVQKQGKKRSKWSFVKRSFKRAYSIAKYCRKIKPDFSITNTIVDPSLAIACKLLNIPHIWFIHEIADCWQDHKFIFKNQTIHRLVNRLSKQILLPSEFAKQYYLNDIPSSKLTILNQSVEINLVASVQATEKRKESYTVLLVGTFDSNKGQKELIDAIKLLHDRGRKVQCFLVGNGSDIMNNCKCSVIEYQLEDAITIVPYTNNIEQYYQLADVVTICSGLESFGRVSIEALKFGIPLILSNVGANPEHIQDQVNGLLYQKGNIADLADKIEILSNPDTRRKFANNIDPNICNKYTIYSFSEEFKKILKQ